MIVFWSDIRNNSKKQSITLWKSAILIQLKKPLSYDFHLGQFTCTTIHIIEFIIGSFQSCWSLLGPGVPSLSLTSLIKVYSKSPFLATNSAQEIQLCTKWIKSRVEQIKLLEMIYVLHKNSQNLTNIERNPWQQTL